MESLFKVKERGSTVAREVTGGLTTFLAMVYIAAVNPAILAEAGLPFHAALTATCLSAALFADANGEIDRKDLQPILVVDSIAAAVGGFFGASSVTVFVESVVGAAAGARTGLSSIVVGIMFVLLAFLAPFIGMVSGSATCGALTVVGYLMMKSIGDIDWSRIELGFPAFLIVVGIPFTYSIANGIGLGFISYVVILVLTGRVRDVKPLMWVAALAFLVMFVVG